MMIICFFSPLFDFKHLILTFEDGGKQITRLDTFNIILENRRCCFNLSCVHYNNMSEIVGLSKYVTIVPI